MRRTRWLRHVAHALGGMMTAACFADDPRPSAATTPSTPVAAPDPVLPWEAVAAGDAGPPAASATPVVDGRKSRPKSAPVVVAKKKPEQRKDAARRISDTADFLQTEGALLFDGTKLLWTPENAKDGALTLRLKDVASVDGAGDRFTVKMKSGATHKFKVPSGKGWARDVNEAL